MTRRTKGLRQNLGWAVQTGGLLATTWALAPEPARAAGVEDTVGGTVALGRAANYARVNDFMATWQNPANLAISPDSIGLELRISIFNACFDRARNNTSEDLDMNGEPGIQYRPEETFDEVCNEAFPLPAGNAGFSLKLSDKLGIGAGVFTPAGVGNLKFGSDRNPSFEVSPGEQYTPTVGGQLSPNRYLLLERQVLAAFVSAGIGYAPIDSLRFGLGLAAGFADVHYKNMAGQTPFAQEEDILNDVHVSDYFIPRVTASVAATPFDALDLMFSFVWNDDINATGYVDVTSNGLKGAPRKDCYERAPNPDTGRTKPTPGPNCRADGVDLSVPYQRFEATLGVRYADRRVARGTTLDPLSEENWDIEVDGYWVNTGHVRDFTLDVYPAEIAEEERAFIGLTGDPADNALSIPSRASLPHRWNDTFGVRAGGDYNVLPSRLAVRAGVAYETRGVPIENMNIDYWPVQKVTVSAGVTWRFSPKLEMSAAYAHTFNETIEVPVGDGNVRKVVIIPPGLVVNEGRYWSSIDTISLQGNYRF